MHSLLALAIETGRQFQSPQTGFLHYHSNALPGERHDTVPIVENFLYALALLRSRTIESGNEGARLVDRLLPFQSPCGNFPVCLHEFPVCQDRFLPVRLLPVFYLLLRDCTRQIESLPAGGKSVLQRLKKNVAMAVQYALDACDETLPHYPTLLSLAAGAAAIARLNGDKATEGRALELLKKLPEAGKYLLQPRYLGEMIYAHRLLGQEVPVELTAFCHEALRCYAGPAYCEYQLREEPEAVFLDFLLAGDQLPSRIKKCGITALLGALVEEGAISLPNKCGSLIVAGEIEGMRYMVDSKKNYVIDCIDRLAALPNYKGHHPFRVLWENQDKLCSCSLQLGYPYSATVKQEGEGRFVVQVAMGAVEGEQDGEIVLCINRHEGVNIRVDGDSATLVKSEEEVVIEDQHMAIGFRYRVIDGEVTGHIMPGNRLAQIGNKGSERYAAYDWTVGLRTLRRSDRCRVEIELTVTEKG